jgi:hypothetical protein
MRRVERVEDPAEGRQLGAFWDFSSGFSMCPPAAPLPTCRAPCASSRGTRACPPRGFVRRSDATKERPAAEKDVGAGLERMRRAVYERDTAHARPLRAPAVNA